MKNSTIITLLSFYMTTFAQQTNEKLYPFTLGSVTPKGWILEQMQQDVVGFVGNLDVIVPDLIGDPIYGEGRLQKHSKAKDLGNFKQGDAAGEEQYKWWNSETQSNWWDGYLRHVFLTSDKRGIEKVKSYVSAILATQDEDGYIGIYDPELRYRFTTENGELWSKATLYRGLLAYYEFTQDKKVFTAIERAVANVMQNYPIYGSSPFSSGTSFNGGVSHGLTFTDILEKMYQLTRNEKYREYALFLYTDFSNTYQSEADAQLHNIANPDYKLTAHGVHTFEHLRALIIAKYASKSKEFETALSRYLTRIKNVTTPSGGAIGDEWIAERSADATHTGYEYCSLHELLDSYCLLLQKEGDATTGDAIENLYFNAALGARNPKHSCIAYLKTDNSYEMMGTKNGEAEPNRKQTRYKYSPAHQDVAVCCNPNAGRITPYFVQNSWLKENDSTFVAVFLIPTRLNTICNGNSITIENSTQYPFENTLQFTITQSKASHFTLKIRKPSWVNQIITKEKYRLENDYIVIERIFNRNDLVAVSFDSGIQIRTTITGEHYFTYGALVYALPIEANEISGKKYTSSFTDFTYEPASDIRYAFREKAQSEYKKGIITTTLTNLTTGKPETVQLIPMGKTILRQVTF